MIVAPHPDDEVLTCGGTIAALARAGAHVRVVLLTAGDGYARAARRTGGTGPDAYRRLGGLRFAESVAACALLGLAREDVVCLGYADGSLAEMAADPRRVLPGRTADATVPYAFAVRPGAPRTGADLAADLVEQVRAFEPDTVVHPDAAETHPDHAAAAELCQSALGSAGFEGMRLTTFVHRGHYPFPWVHRPAGRMLPPRSLAGSHRAWTLVELEAADVAAKEAALALFATQYAIPDLRWFMRAFVRANELFART